MFGGIAKLLAGQISHLLISRQVIRCAFST
jgi:hypothetical protein